MHRITEKALWIFTAFAIMIGSFASITPNSVSAATTSTGSAIIHNFTKDGKSGSAFSITGNLSTSYGKVSYNGLSLTQCLKMESSTNVTFNASSKATLTLVFSADNKGKKVKIDGTNYSIDTTGILSVDLAAGSHTIKKGDTAQLFYISLSESGSSVTPPATTTTPEVTTAPPTTTKPPTTDAPATTSTTSATHNFTTNGKTSNIFSITGNLSSAYGKVTYNSISLTECLKMESSTKITFNTTSDSTITLVFRTNENGKKVKINGTNYTIGSNGLVTATLKSGSHTIAKGDSAYLYYIEIKGGNLGDASGNVDNTPSNDSGYSSDNPSLSARYKNNFIFGAALNDAIVNGTAKAADKTTNASAAYNKIIDQNFTSMTAENSMKPDSTLNQAKSKANLTSNDSTMKGMPGINTEHIDRNLKYAIDHGLKVRYHVLIWHSQMPAWFFDTNYEQTRANSSSPYTPINEVSKKVLIQRMESYIKQVFDYINTTKYNGVYYKDAIYTYDVVNEAMTGDAKKYYFYKIFNGKTSDDANDYAGDVEYISYSFQFARKYADSKATLIYNDYGCYWPGKRDAIYNMVKAVNSANSVNTKGVRLIDGVGMQMHIGIKSPRTTGADIQNQWDGGSIESAIRKFASLGEVQITELDVSGDSTNPNTNKAAAAARYKDVMQLLLNLDNTSGIDITSVSVWGVSDKDSWILKEHCLYPLPFGSDLKPNDAYKAMLLEDSETELAAVSPVSWSVGYGVELAPGSDTDANGRNLDRIEFNVSGGGAPTGVVNALSGDLTNVYLKLNLTFKTDPKGATVDAFNLILNNVWGSSIPVQASNATKTMDIYVPLSSLKYNSSDSKLHIHVKQNLTVTSASLVKR